jgi:hypothetical protein
MSRIFWAALLVLVVFSPSTQAQQESEPLSVDLAGTYSAERAKIATSNCGCFWLQGGSLNGGVTLFRGLGVAANLTGEHASNAAPSVDVNKLAFMVGPRYTLNPNRWLHANSRANIFGEALFGFAHSFDSVFPTATGLTTSATAFSMQVGGGVNIGLAKGFGLRAVEINYVRTSLPNNASNTQNDLRLAIGISYHLRLR